MKRFQAFLISLLASLSIPALAQDVYITSLDWPPYTGATLTEKGATSMVVIAAFKASGLNPIIEFYPWERATHMVAEEGSKYIAYMPEYYSDDLAKKYIFSKPIGHGPLGFVERKDTPVNWTTLNDLANIKIGVVNGYVNTADFDARVANHQLSVEGVTSDSLNIKKVSAKHIAIAVIDQNVLNYLLKTDKDLAADAPLLQFNAKPLEDKQLFVCFKKTPEGQKMADIFNAGLEKIDANKIMTDYFSKHI
jgi:hypothetical protein